MLCLRCGRASSPCVPIAAACPSCACAFCLIPSHSSAPCCRRDGRWEEDEEYTALLGRGWHLEGVREACYKALARVGKEAMHFRWAGAWLAAA